jgi:hypothetical protein
MKDENPERSFASLPERSPSGRGETIHFILHPSSFILHPSSFILLLWTVSRPSGIRVIVP